MPLPSVSATAPASIANVAVGFDILGHAFGAAADTVTASRHADPGVHLGTVSGLVSSLPKQVFRNTALAAAAAVLHAAQPRIGVRIDIVKGVPMAAGMGGSAASAVAAAAAVNTLIGEPFSREELIPFALAGESVASNPPHWDNVIASLFGGLKLVASQHPIIIKDVPVPPGVLAIVLHPHVQVETSKARAILKPEVPMNMAIEQIRRSSGFFLGCATGDVDLIRACLEDVLVEPQRAHLFPALPHVQQAALRVGAIGCSFSGSGPSIFAWAKEAEVKLVEQAMVEALSDRGVSCTSYIGEIHSEGVRVRQLLEGAAQ